MDANFQVKLIDFGVAHKLSQGLAKDLVGTEGYKAPEVIENVPYCALIADIFSIGVTLYFLLTGDKPWLNASTEDCYYNCF